jgi:TolB-like protein/DNA-binding winged helix-turn-helix (wHTH) protein/tetratricopeptide (TPR) repeat protein
MQPSQAHPSYQFGEFELDTLRRVLVSRGDGRPVDITGRVIDALIYFVERPGQLVEKKALIEALWPHVVVEEGNLTQTIHTLRRVLGEKSGEHRYIATVPGRGYRFVAEVTVRGEPAAVEPAPVQPAPVDPVPATPAAVDTPPSRRSKWLPTAIASCLVLLIVAGVLAWSGRDQPASPAVVAQPSIAVLPFVDMSAEQDQMHFAEGLSEEILNILARSDAMRVIARTSSFSFRDQNADIGTIAQRLAVSHVLEGSVRKSGDRVRITAQLIDASTSAHLWSETYDRDVRDIFGVQREIATAVADALHVSLRRLGPTRAETSSAQAYEHYLQGRHLFHRRTGADLLQAKSHFEKAVQIDPDYGRAWGALAGFYLVARYDGLDPPDAMRKWGEAVERAAALAPDSAEVQIRVSQYYRNVGDEDAADLHLARAAALDPQEPLLLGRAVGKAINEGRIEEAIELQRSIVAKDPLSAVNRGTLGSTLIIGGYLPEAQAELERALELSPAATQTLSSVADVLILRGRTEEGLAVASRMPAGYLRDRHLAIAHYARGEVREGDAILARLIALSEKPTFDPEVTVAVAEVYVASHRPDRAFDWLDSSHRRAQTELRVVQGVLKNSLRGAPFLKPLHADPRWGKLMAASRN